MPTNLKLLRGNPGKQKINWDEPQPELPPASTEPPEYLIGYGRAEWNRIATELFRLKLLSTLDIHQLGVYCRAFHTWRTANEMIDKMARNHGAGLVVDGGSRTTITNPLVRIARQAAADMLVAAREFGFTPSSRSRVNTVSAQRPKHKFDGLIAG